MLWPGFEPTSVELHWTSGTFWRMLYRPSNCAAAALNFWTQLVRKLFFQCGPSISSSQVCFRQMDEALKWRMEAILIFGLHLANETASSSLKFSSRPNTSKGLLAWIHNFANTSLFEVTCVFSVVKFKPLALVFASELKYLHWKVWAYWIWLRKWLISDLWTLACTSL